MKRWEKIGAHRVGDSLSARQRAVLIDVAHGYTNEEIAARLGLSYETVRYHRKAAYMRLGVSTSEQAVVVGIRLGIV